MNDLGDTNCYVVIVAKEDQMCVLFGMPDAFLFLRSVGDVLYVCAAVVVLVW